MRNGRELADQLRAILRDEQIDLFHPQQANMLVSCQNAREKQLMNSALIILTKEGVVRYDARKRRYLVQNFESVR